MDKIVYTCSAEHIGFIFPKRKWWDLSKKPREARLEAAETFSDKKIRVLMRIWEDGSSIDNGLSGMMQADAKEVLPYHIHVPAAYREEIRLEFVRQSCRKREFEVLLIVDADGDTLVDLLVESAEDVNYLAIFTKNPKQYELVLEKIVQETGLIGMIFTEYRDFRRYERLVCEGRNVLVFLGNRKSGADDKIKTVFFHLPKGSLVLDFWEQESGKKMVRTKRMENDYVSVPVFLDNVIKNGYNSLVNEGLQTENIQISCLRQNVYRTDDENKLSEKRKGIKKWKKRRIF